MFVNNNGNSVFLVGTVTNLLLLFQFFAKEGLDIPKDFIEGTIHCKPGAASSLIERAYTLLTHKT